MNEWLVGVAVAFVVLSATVAVLTRDPTRQAVVLSVLGLGLAILFAVLQAPDVALSQLAVGTALTPLMILLTVRKITRQPTRPHGDAAQSRTDEREGAERGRVEGREQG
ncbi:Na(+)/H(+) antiporter subunit B [Streptomyces sp. NPDC056944]|uniref:Na(+)/H(+) antiporter subunit B n=1 Tax=unclassified Streptomyces TaxID=2593676 RepID=UPI0036332F67